MLLVAAATLGACSPGGPATGKNENAAPADLKSADIKAHSPMAMKHTDDPDADFIRAMIPHHEGAIEMARAEIRAGKDPTALAMAQKIIADQQNEIRQMQDWLTAHQKDGDGPVSDKGGQ